VGAGHRRNPTQNANLVLGVELAGAKPEDVDITLGDSGLTISGERKAEAEEERGDYYISDISERRYGSFSRTFAASRHRSEQDQRPL
jgi:HSP20 family protein